MSTVVDFSALRLSHVCNDRRVGRGRGAMGIFAA